jgi:hypothetical protein
MKLSHLTTKEKGDLMAPVFVDAFRYPTYLLDLVKLRSHPPAYVIYRPQEVIDKWQEERWQYMLNFKNSKGEIVMSEKDNGDLSIHDEVLKESFEKKISLEEAKKKEEEK